MKNKKNQWQATLWMLTQFLGNSACGVKFSPIYRNLIPALNSWVTIPAPTRLLCNTCAANVPSATEILNIASTKSTPNMDAQKASRL